MKVWHDWEFLEKDNSIYPISVGIVTEDDHELYYEFSDAPWHLIREHSWLMENVVPKLGSYSFSSLFIKTKIDQFLYQANNRSSGKLELWGWYSAYDHVCLGQLFGAMVNLPDFIPMYTNDMKQEADRLGVHIPDLRKSDELVHHALDDARVEKRMGDWLRNYSRAATSNVNVSNSAHVQLGNGNTQINKF